MAEVSLANLTSDLNLSRRKLNLFYQLIATGIKMSTALKRLNVIFELSVEVIEIEKEWESLMEDYAQILLRGCGI